MRRWYVMADSGLTLEKMREAKRILDAREVGVDDLETALFVFWCYACGQVRPVPGEPCSSTARGCLERKFRESEEA